MPSRSGSAPPVVAVMIFTGQRVSREILAGIFHFAKETRAFHPHQLFDPSGSELRDGAEGARGLIARCGRPRYQKFIRSLGVPVVLAAEHAGPPGSACVHWDNIEVGRLAADHLLAQGHHHFAFVSSSQNGDYSRHRRLGFAEALPGRRVAHLDVSEIRDTSWRAARHRIRMWLKRQPRPLAVLADTDDCATEVIEACVQAKLDVPGQVAVMGVGNEELLCNFMRVPMSSVALPAFQVGYVAARQMAEILAGAAPSETPLLLRPEGVVIRRSTEQIVFPDPLVTRAVKLIRDHAHEPIAISKLLGHLPASRRALEMRFKAATGHTLQHEIWHQHVRRAMQLLEETDLSIENVSEGSGFASSRMLSEKFHQLTGRTPSAFRKAVRKGAAATPETVEDDLSGKSSRRAQFGGRVQGRSGRSLS